MSTRFHRLIQTPVRTNGQKAAVSTPTCRRFSGIRSSRPVHSPVIIRCSPHRILLPLLINYKSAKKAGQPVTTTTEHTVQRNDWWGIEGGQQVQVTWCHLDRGSAWECQLATDIRDAINRGIIIFCCMVRSAIFPTTRPCWKTVLN